MPRTPRRVRSLWCVLLLVLHLLSLHAHAAPAAADGRCKPQGLLKLDRPFPAPRRVTLPFCQQYGCSCCNASHALALQRASRVIAEDEDLSQDCKLGLLRLTCRLCDPQVGTGAKRHTCSDTCRTLFEACAQDFFSYDSGSGLVSPCSEHTGGMLVCSHLTDLVSSPAEFCKAAGLGRMQPADAGDEPCFDGSPVGADACPAAPQGDDSSTSTQQQTQQRRQRRKASSSSSSDPLSRLLSLLPWRLKRRHRKQLAVAAELLIGTAITSLMAWLTLVVLRRVMQPTRQRRPLPGGPPPTNVREVLARAAEVRSAAAGGGGNGSAGQQKRQ